jgi:hypothetical protein
MNTHSVIPHRMFIAALSGERHSPTPPPGPPLQVLVESTAPSAGVSLDEKRRSEAVSAIALRQVFEWGARYEVRRPGGRTSRSMSESTKPHLLGLLAGLFLAAGLG